MSWMLAGVIGGVVAWVADYVMWGQVFTTGMESYGTMEGARDRMAAMMMKSAALAIAWGLVFAFIYRQVMNALWVAPGPLAGMEFASTLWLGTIPFVSWGSGVWYDKARRLLNAQIWAWLVRMNAAGLVVGLLIR